MANSLIQEEISKELEHLPFDKQKKVLEFVRSLVSPPTTGAVSYTHLTLPTKRIV